MEREGWPISHCVTKSNLRHHNEETFTNLIIYEQYQSDKEVTKVYRVRLLSD